MKAIAIVLVIVASAGAAETVRGEDWAQSVAPVYRGVEAVADGVYGLVRGHMISAVLPGGLSRRMSAVPLSSSDREFAQRLHFRQEKAARRLVEIRPTGPVGAAELAAFQREAAASHLTVLTDAVADTLVRRYQLERFGKDSGAYASHLANWDPGFIASAAVLGGAYLYVAGLRTDFNVGPLRVDFDTRPCSALKGAIQNGDARGLAALTLSRRGSPVSLKTEWGVKDGRMASERVGMNYSTRF